MEVQYYQFKLKKNQKYIQLNHLLQIIDVVQTGGHAKLMIQDEAVTLNGETETRIRKKLYEGDVIAFEDSQIEIINYEQAEEE